MDARHEAAAPGPAGAPAAATAVAVVGVTVAGVSSAGAHSTIEPIAAVLDYYMLGRLSIERGRLEVDAGLLVAAVAALVIIPGKPRVIDVAGTWTSAVGVPFAVGRAVGARAALRCRPHLRRLE